MKRSHDTDFPFMLPILLAILIYPSKHRTRIINGRRGREEVLDNARRSQIPPHGNVFGLPRKSSPEIRLASSIALVDPVYAIALLTTSSYIDDEHRRKSFSGTQKLARKKGYASGQRKNKPKYRSTIRGK